MSKKMSLKFLNVSIIPFKLYTLNFKISSKIFYGSFSMGLKNILKILYFKNTLKTLKNFNFKILKN